MKDSKMADADLRNMIMNFRVSDLQVLLGFAGRNKTGKKQELQSRALDLVKMKSPAVDMKIKELHNRRYHNQLHIMRPNNYDIPDRTLTDRPISNYDSSMNNNYAMRNNSNFRPMAIGQNTVPGYSGKNYLPPVPPQPPFSPYANVKFRELPFFDTLHVLMSPFVLAANALDRCQENTYTFTLSPQEAHDLAVSKDASGNYECQILLRFCLLDTGTEQEDNFPPNIALKVNGKPVPLPNPIPTNRPGVEPKRPSKPVNITPYSKLSPTVTNVITVSWSSTYGRTYASVLYVARLLSSRVLLQRLKQRGPTAAECTKTMIVEKLHEGQDSGIATTSLQASLICPLGKLKMKLPCRSLTCTHIPCFDASLYIQLNEKKPKWRCPVCDKPALFKTLVLDGLFMDIVAQVPPECTDVQFHEDGSWSPIFVKDTKEPKKTVTETVKKAPPNKCIEVVDVSSDSETEDTWKSSKPDFPASSESPPVMFIPPNPSRLTETPTSHMTAFSPFSSRANIDYNTSSNSHPGVEPIPICLTSSVQPELPLSEHMNILPDLISHNPPMSSSNSVITSYPSFPSFDEQPEPQEADTSPSYKNFDFFSLLTSSIPESEHQKYESLQKELAEKDANSTPDIISLD